MGHDRFQINQQELTLQEIFLRQIANGLSTARQKVLWHANEGPQTLALTCEADEIYYGGQPGGGKTDLLIGAAILRHTKSIIFRRESVQLVDIIDRSREVLGVRNGTYNQQSKRWTLFNGKILEFGSCQHEPDKEHYQGRAHDLKAFDEITHFSESMYLYLSGWNRTTKPGQICRIICVGNPPTNIEGRWVSERWRAWLDPRYHNPARPGELRWYIRVDDVDTEVERGCYGKNAEKVVVKISTEEYEARSKAKDPDIYRAKSRTFIPAQLADNPFYGSEYQATIDAMPEPMRTIYKTGNHFFGFEDADFQVIPTAWVLLAMDRWKKKRDQDGGKIIPPLVWVENKNGRQFDRVPARMSALGVDCARGGKDANVFAPRHFNWFAPLVKVPGVQTPTGQDLARLVVREVADNAVINIDVLNVGSSPFDFLNEWQIPNVNAINFGMGCNAVDKSERLRLRNVRAMAWWRMRELLDPNSGEDVMLPDDSELLADLTAPQYTENMGIITIEDKGDIKKRIGRSPDKGDALVMAALIIDRRSWEF